MSAARPFRGTDLAVLIPTMNRPDKLTQLFESLAAQTESVGRVIVVDGAENAEQVVDTFTGRLPGEYYRCHPPGQIRQRNHGLAQLRDTDRLVALLDDDIVLEADAVAEMIKFWNAAGTETAGICFNIINIPPERYSAIRAALGLTARGPGRVLRSGLTTANTHVDRNARVEWLPGGATVWQKEVLLVGHPYGEISARWAIGEDLIFSYPVGKRRPLYVCAAARAHHEHVADYGKARPDRYHGRTQTLWMYHFAASNPDLSAPLFIWTLLLRMTGKFARGFVQRDRASWEFARGQASAFASLFVHLVRRGRTADLLQESDVRGRQGVT